MPLPKNFIIQSTRNDKYLHLDTKNPDLPNGLRFVGDYSYELDTRFKTEPATTPGGFVHIRSMQNNKYWANSGGPHNLVTAMADKPEEVQSNPHCTLFETVGNSWLRHVSTGHYVSCYYGDYRYDDSLCLADKDPVSFIFIDWESILVLPKHIRIKGYYGNNLKAYDGDGFMDFRSHADNSQVYDFEVHPSRNGGIRLKSVHFGTYWTDVEDTPWVFLKPASETYHDIRTVFSPVLTDAKGKEFVNDKEGNFVFMKSLSSNKFCTRIDYGDTQACLATVNFYPEPWGTLKIEDPVFSRKISNVRYHLNNARIYGENIIAVANQEVLNRTQVPNTVVLAVKIQENRTTNWTAGVSFSIGTTASASFGIPLIGEGEIQTSYEFTGEYQWGETNSMDKEIEKEYEVTVPAMSGVKVTLMASEAMCDIPFSYTQHDVMKNGVPRVLQKDDGLFTGQNSHSYKFKATQFEI